MHAHLCRALRRPSRLHLSPVLYLNLNLYLNSVLFPALNRASFRKLLEKSYPALFRWLCGFKYR